MTEAAAPGIPNEASRQQAVDRYRIVDSLPEGAYDDIVRIASTVCDAPIAVVSLLDRDRQWFKARIGIDADETPRSQAVCDQAIRNPGSLFEVSDLSQDPRFADFPVVTEMGARFYAGMPLVTPEGAPVGTVCVLGNEPRELTPEQREALEALARLAIQLLEARHRQREHELAGVLLGGTGEVAEESKPVSVDTDVPFTVAILEMQGYAAAVNRRGERGVEKDLHQLETQLEPMLQRDRGDTINRVTGSAEFVAVLQGDASDRVAAIQRALLEYELGSGARVLLGSAVSSSAREPTQQVFMRADAALSAEKDRLAESARAA